MKDGHLWDRSSPVDAEVERLEQALRSHRWSGEVPAAPPPARAVPRVATWLAVAAAAALLVALPFVLAGESPDEGGFVYLVEALDGAPRLESRASDGRLRAGDALVTDERSRARLEVGQLGDVVLEPGTRLRVERPEQGATGAEHLLFLERGTVAVSIFAAPRVFQVGTPAGIAVDLGCIYTATVEADGSTRLAVVSGQVSFEADGRRAIVPSGAWCRARPGDGPGPAFREDAPAALVEAAERIARSADPGAEAVGALLATADASEDALTLWHLLEHPSADLRAAVFGVLSAVEPPPEDLDADGLLSGDRAALDLWRHAMSWSW